VPCTSILFDYICYKRFNEIKLLALKNRKKLKEIGDFKITLKWKLMNYYIPFFEKFSPGGIYNI